MIVVATNHQCNQDLKNHCFEEIIHDVIGKGDKSPEQPQPETEVINVAENGDKSPEKPEPKIEVILNGDKSPEEAGPDEIEIIDESRP